MGAKFFDSIPHRSFPLQAGQFNRISEMAITVAQIDATEFGTNRITVTEMKPKRGDIIAKKKDSVEMFVYQDGKDVTAYIHALPENKLAMEFPYPTKIFTDATTMALEALSKGGARTAVLDYGSTFPSLGIIPSREHYFDVFLSGISRYVNAVNAGHVDSPIVNIIIALDEAAYAIWQREAPALVKDFLSFDPPFKRKLLQERKTLESVHLSLGAIGSWLPYITQDGANHEEVMQKVILACMVQDAGIRRRIEDWDSFALSEFDGNYFEILENHAVRESWDGLMNLFPNHSISASTVVDHLQTMTDPLTTKAIKKRLLMFADSDRK